MTHGGEWLAIPLDAYAAETAIVPDMLFVNEPYFYIGCKTMFDISIKLD